MIQLPLRAYWDPAGRRLILICLCGSFEATASDGRAASDHEALAAGLLVLAGHAQRCGLAWATNDAARLEAERLRPTPRLKGPR